MKKVNPKSLVKRDIEYRKVKTNAQMTDRKYKALLDEIEQIRKERDAFKAVKPINTFTIKPYKPTGESEATMVAIASDFHLEEIVKKSSVNGLNEFNEVIAQKRVEMYFQRLVRMHEIFSRDIEIKNLVLCLAGDFLSGNIHEELLENTNKRPIEAVMFAQNLLTSGIEYILKHTKLNLVIPCSSGNHARITKKTHISTEQGNSLEHFMYHSMASYFRNEKRVKFIIHEGYHTYVNIYSYTIRVHHGHAIKYNGGVGTIFIPVMKAIAAWDRSIRADLDVFGHYHTAMDGGKFISNGSLIGYNAFAVAIKASFEKPKQMVFLIDKKRGKTIVAPIVLD